MSKTPPPGPIPGPETPIHTRSMTTDRYGGKFEDREDVFQRLSLEMKPYFVGPMLPSDFLTNFLPNNVSSDLTTGMFATMKNVASEAEMSTAFVRPTLTFLF
jgi:hypothetical protein